MPFFLAPAEGFGNPRGSQWWLMATTRGAPLGPPGGVSAVEICFVATVVTGPSTAIVTGTSYISRPPKQP